MHISAFTSNTLASTCSTRPYKIVVGHAELNRKHKIWCCGRKTTAILVLYCRGNQTEGSSYTPLRSQRSQLGMVGLPRRQKKNMWTTVMYMRGSYWQYGCFLLMPVHLASVTRSRRRRGHKADVRHNAIFESLLPSCHVAWHLPLSHPSLMLVLLQQPLISEISQLYVKGSVTGQLLPDAGVVTHGRKPQ